MSMPAERLSSRPLLSDLLAGFAEAPALPVEGIATDSRALQPGFVFLAVQGLTSHGLDYLDTAIDAGVAAVAFDAATGTAPAAADVPMIPVPGLTQHIGEIANRFYGRPSEHLSVFGVTGTNGKTTVAWMIAQAGAFLDRRCGYLGTLGYGIDEIRAGEGMTTPPNVTLHGRLADFVDDGAAWAAIEVSSHALSQHRVDGVRFDAALFTNLSRDHLDYHADMAEYFESKARLFLECGPKDRIINLDSEFGAQLASRCGPNVVTVSTKFDRVTNGRPYVFVRSVVATDEGSNIAFVSSWGDGRFTLCVPGDFNVANAVLVLALLLRKGIDVDQACDVMSQLTAPPGRMQRVAAPGPAVYIDYAHTPDALELALRALRAHARGRLWCVFGCGGHRDPGKRPQMGRAAERQADHVILTNDNPRGEDPAEIFDDIVAGIVNPDRVTVIEDRATAIAWAVGQADDEDIVLVAGKGHEDYQQLATETRPLSDYAIAVTALRAREGGA